MKSDIWSLGCILFYLFANKRPWGNSPDSEIILEMQKKNSFLILEDQKTLEKIPYHILKLIKKCTKFEIDKRPDALTILTKLKDFSNGL